MPWTVKGPLNIIVICILYAVNMAFPASGGTSAHSKRYNALKRFESVTLIMPPFEKGGAYCFAHVSRYVGRSVSLNLVQLITQEHFAPEASNLVGR